MSNSTSSKTGSGAYILAAIGALLIMAALVSFTIRNTRPVPLGSDRAEERRAALAQLRGEERKAMTTYDWVNKDSGVVRLPVDRAMELTLQAGDSAALRKDRLARLEKATTPPPKAPEQPSAFE